LFVVDVRSVPWLTFITVTLALGITPPLGSVTVPLSVAPVTWAAARDRTTPRNNATESDNNGRPINLERISSLGQGEMTSTNRRRLSGCLNNIYT
jgi:hypothetical protein